MITSVITKQKMEGKVGDYELVGHSWYYKGKLGKRQQLVWDWVKTNVLPGDKIPFLSTIADQVKLPPSQVLRVLKGLARKGLVSFPQNLGIACQVAQPQYDNYIHWVCSVPFKP